MIEPNPQTLARTIAERKTSTCDSTDNGLTATPFTATRRTVLKGLALSGAAVAMPGVAQAIAQQPHDTLDSGAMPVINADGISVEFSDPESNSVDGSLARVTISNYSGHEVELKQLSPGVVTTRQGVYNINSRLDKSPVAVKPGGTYHFWIKPDNEPQTVSRMSRGDTTPHRGRQAMVPVTVVRGESQYVSAQHTRLAHAVFV